MSVDHAAAPTRISFDVNFSLRGFEVKNSAYKPLSV